MLNCSSVAQIKYFFLSSFCGCGKYASSKSQSKQTRRTLANIIKPPSIIMKIIAILLLFVNFNSSYSQTFAHEKQRHKFNTLLISKNIKNKLLKKSFEKGYEYEVKYLGKIKTKNGQFYILNSSYVHLKSLHNDNEIFVYDENKRFVGYYNLADNYQLPTKLIGNILYFKTDNCVNKINFGETIPKVICLQCDDFKDCIEFQKLK